MVLTNLPLQERQVTLEASFREFLEKSTGESFHGRKRCLSLFSSFLSPKANGGLEDDYRLAIITNRVDLAN